MSTSTKVAHVDRYLHPHWCSPVTCEVAGDNVLHAEVVGRWKAGRSDTAVTVSMTQLDEVFQGEQIVYEPDVTVHFEFLAGCHVAAYKGEEIDIAAYAKLSAADCRELATTLLNLADRLDDATPTAAIPVQRPVALEAVKAR